MLTSVSVRGSENVAYLGSLLLRVSFPRRDFTVFNFLYGLELALRLTILCVDRVCHAYASTEAWKYKLKRGKRHQNINARQNFPSLCCAEIGVGFLCCD